MAVTNEAGNYTITPVTVGTYVVKAELAGFRHDHDLATDARGDGRSRGSTSRWGSAASPRPWRSSSVAPILQTETSTVGEVLSGNTVQSLPLNGRNTGQLALLLPGTITYNPRGFTNIGSVNMNRPFVNGNREQTNNFTVDGLDVNETIDNRVAYQPSPDASPRSASKPTTTRPTIGNVGGAVISSVIKSGTNRVSRQRVRVLPQQRLRREHVGEQPLGCRRSRSASSTSSAAPSAARSSANRLFFFADYQGSRQDAPGFQTASVAPEAWRRGDLSSVTTPIRDPLTGLPFPGNQIPLEADQPNRARDPERPGELPAAQPDRARRGHRELCR